MSARGWVELERRVQNSGWFRWLPGMANTDGSRVVRVSHPWAYVVDDGGAECGVFRASALGVPNLRDAATVGALLCLAQEACDDISAYTSIDAPMESIAVGLVRCLEDASGGEG